MSVSTSQIEKRESFMQRKGIDPGTLVIIEIGEVSFLKKRSCFDCNKLVTYGRHDIYGKYIS